MYEAIPPNLSQILLKRLFIFIALFVLVMATIYLRQSVLVHPATSVQTGDSFIEINKSSFLLNS
jgi:hypothetical protein